MLFVFVAVVLVFACTKCAIQWMMVRRRIYFAQLHLEFICLCTAFYILILLTTQLKSSLCHGFWFFMISGLFTEDVFSFKACKTAFME